MFALVVSARRDETSLAGDASSVLLRLEAGNDGALLCLTTSQSNAAISLVRWTDLVMLLLSRALPYILIPLDLELSLLALTSVFVLVLC